MVEKDFPISLEKIELAERERTKGLNMAACTTLMGVMRYPIEEFPDLSINAQTRLLMAARIYVVASLSYAKTPWRAPMVAKVLEIPKAAIESVYRNKYVAEASRNTILNTRGNPYDFDIEMAKDEVSYSLIIARLTGNLRQNEFAIERYADLADQTQEPTLKTELLFRRSRLILDKEPSRQTYEMLKQAYKNAVEASRLGKNYERMATIASKFAITAQSYGHALDMINAITTNLESINHNRSTYNIWFREIGKETTDSIKTFMWRLTTPKGKDYSYLKLY